MRALTLVLIGVLVGGCSLVPTVGDRGVARAPGNTGVEAVRALSATTDAGPVAIAQATHEYPAAPVHQRVTDGAADAVAAVRSFAEAYINWNATSVSADMQALAGQSIGQARSAVELAAAQTAQDYELKQGGVANQGVVEAIARLPGHPREFVVVTRERTTATSSDVYQGLAPAWHVAVASATEVAPGKWAVSGWQPQS